MSPRSRRVEIPPKDSVVRFTAEFVSVFTASPFTRKDADAREDVSDAALLSSDGHVARM